MLAEWRKFHHQDRDSTEFKKMTYLSEGHASILGKNQMGERKCNIYFDAKEVVR